MSHYLPVISAFVTLLVTTLLVFGKNISKAPQSPPIQQVESGPVPRTGGIGLMCGILTGWALLLRELHWWLVLPLLVVFVLSLVDEMQGLSLHKRLGGQTLAALLVLLGSGMAGQYPWAVPLLVLALVWMTNLYNFMDGADGLAGGMTFFGFTAYGVAALMGGAQIFAMLSFAVAAAALGFLYYNFAPAKIFMGDAGSIPLGFLAGAMGFAGWQDNLWAWWFPVLVFLPFIADTTITQVKRSFAGKKITESHREHYYQRLIKAGMGHRDLAVGAYLLMGGGAVSALYALGQARPWVTFLFWLVLYVILVKLALKRWKAGND